MIWVNKKTKVLELNKVYKGPLVIGHEITNNLDFIFGFLVIVSITSSPFIKVDLLAGTTVGWLIPEAADKADSCCWGITKTPSMFIIARHDTLLGQELAIVTFCFPQGRFSSDVALVLVLGLVSNKDNIHSVSDVHIVVVNTHDSQWWQILSGSIHPLWAFLFHQTKHFAHCWFALGHE